LAEGVDQAWIDLYHLAHVAEVHRLLAVRPVHLDRVHLFRHQGVRFASGHPYGLEPGVAQRYHHPVVDAGQHGLGYLQRHIVGDAQPCHLLDRQTAPFHLVGDLRPSAMKDDRRQTALPEFGYLPGEGVDLLHPSDG